MCLIPSKRVILVCGHYGSGKTSIALSLAFALKNAGINTALADLDIVNPYFRSADSRKELEAAGIPLIASGFASSNVDLPALPSNLYAITDGSLDHVIVDVGGDDRGALALGRLREALLAENNYEMLLVINRFRPLTKDAESVCDIRAEIEAACGIPFTGIINNSNLGSETTREIVLSSLPYADDVSRKTGLPLFFTSVCEEIATSMQNEVPGIFPIQLQKQPF